MGQENTRELWVEAGQALLPDTIALRRAIHEEPELGLFTPKTTREGQGGAGRPAAGDPGGNFHLGLCRDAQGAGERAHGAAARATWMPCR